MDLLIQLASPILTAVMAVGGAYIAFNNRLTILETKDSDHEEVSHGDDSQLAEIKTDVAVLSSKFESLAEEVRKHNNLIERTYKLEARVDSIESKL